MSRVVLLTNILAPYRVPVFSELNRELDGQLTVVLVAETEAQRQWKIRRDGLPFKCRILKPGLMPRGLAEQTAAARRMWGVLGEEQPSAIVSGGYDYLPAWVAYGYARLRGIRFLLWVESNLHDLRKTSGLRERLKRRIVRGADGIIVPGQASAAYARSLGATEAKIYFAPNAVDGDFFAREAGHFDAARERARRGLPARLLLYVGRLVREKGVYDLLEAFRIVIQTLPDVGLVIVGDGPERAALEEICEQQQIAQVYFEGFRQQEELPYYYALADLLVFPTHSDPWGLVINEAFSCGLPVVASRVAGASADLVREGQTGAVVEPRQPVQLAAAIVRLLGNPQHLCHMGLECRRVIQQFSPVACARGIAIALKEESSQVSEGLVPVGPTPTSDGGQVELKPSNPTPCGSL